MGSANEAMATYDDYSFIPNIYQFKPYRLEQLMPVNMDPDLPKGRSGHRIVSDNSSVYSFGGYNPYVENHEAGFNGDGGDTKLFKELWRFNLAINEWEKLSYYDESLPKELASNAVVMKGHTMIVHGGTGVPFGLSCSNKTYITNLKDDKCLKLIKVKGEPPTPQYGQAMALKGHCLYVMGGTSGFDYSADIHCLNLKNGVWNATYICKGLSRFEPSSRYRHEVALYNSKIIVLGGGTADDAFGFQHLNVFNLETKEWEKVQTIGDPNCEDVVENQGYPAPRRCHGSVQVPEDETQGPEVIISGGFDGMRIFSDIWKLNLHTLQWTNLKEKLVTPLYFHSTSVSPCGKMFIFGGICEIFNDDEDFFTVRTNEIFSIWVKIPKLSEICWDAMLFYNSELGSHDKSKLLNSGVPIQFVERIQKKS